MTAAQATTLATALAALGPDADAVAEALAAGGHRGQRREWGRSPVDRYLDRLCGAAGLPYRWETGNDSAVGRFGGRRTGTAADWAPPVSLALPPGVRAFVGAFEAGRYPALEAAR